MAPILIIILVMINLVDVKLMKLNLVTLSLLLLSSCVAPQEETFLVSVERCSISDQDRTQRFAGMIGRLTGTISEHQYHTRYAHDSGCTNSCCD